MVYSCSIADPLRRLERVFQKLREHGLKIEAAKCQFFKARVKYLGHVVSSEGVATDPAKTEAVARWPTPKRLIKDLRSFLGFASYYRRFVPGFAQTAAPLLKLTADISEKGRKKNSTITSERWNGECQQAFDDLCTALTTAPVLAYPDLSKPFIVETDASDKGLGAVLSQKRDGKLRVIAYASRGLLGAELPSFNFKIEYRADKHSTDADALSRIRWQKTHECSAEEKEDAGVDTLTAEKLAKVADTTRIPERVQLELLKDAIRVEELGVTRPTDECAGQVTSLPSMPRDQIAALQQKDAAVATLRHYLDLGRKPSRAERK